VHRSASLHPRVYAISCQIFPGSVYLNQGRTYIIEQMDPERLIARARRVPTLPYHTKTRDHTAISVTAVSHSVPLCRTWVDDVKGQEYLRSFTPTPNLRSLKTEVVTQRTCVWGVVLRTLMPAYCMLLTDDCGYVDSASSSAVVLTSLPALSDPSSTQIKRLSGDALGSQAAAAPTTGPAAAATALTAATARSASLSSSEPQPQAVAALPLEFDLVARYGRVDVHTVVYGYFKVMNIDERVGLTPYFPCRKRDAMLC